MGSHTPSLTIGGGRWGVTHRHSRSEGVGGESHTVTYILDPFDAQRSVGPSVRPARRGAAAVGGYYNANINQSLRVDGTDDGMGRVVFARARDGTRVTRTPRDR